MIVLAEVNVAHYCNKEQRIVHPGEILTLSKVEFKKRFKVKRNDVPVVSLVKNQHLPSENVSYSGGRDFEVKDASQVEEPTFTRSRLQQMRKDQLVDLAHSVIEDTLEPPDLSDHTKNDLIEIILEENEDD